METEKTGTVDFVSQSGSKTYVTINGDQFELDKVNKVWDDTYAGAYTVTNSWSKLLKDLPNASLITANNKDTYRQQVESLYASYMSMDDYTKSFLSEDDKFKFSDLIGQYRILGDDIENVPAYGDS